MTDTVGTSIQPMTGIVSGVGNKGGGGFYLKDGNDIFYSCREASQRAGVMAGSEVMFNFSVNPNAKDPSRPYHNIQGQVAVIGEAIPVPAAQAGADPAPAPAAQASSGTTPRDRSIISQASFKASCELHSGTGVPIEKVIADAGQLMDYTLTRMKN